MNQLQFDAFTSNHYDADSAIWKCPCAEWRFTFGEGNKQGIFYASLLQHIRRKHTVAYQQMLLTARQVAQSHFGSSVLFADGVNRTYRDNADYKKSTKPPQGWWATHADFRKARLLEILKDNIRIPVKRKKKEVAPTFDGWSPSYTQDIYQTFVMGSSEPLWVPRTAMAVSAMAYEQTNAALPVSSDPEPVYEPCTPMCQTCREIFEQNRREWMDRQERRRREEAQRIGMSRDGYMRANEIFFSDIVSRQQPTPVPASTAPTIDEPTEALRTTNGPDYHF